MARYRRWPDCPCHTECTFISTTRTRSSTSGALSGAKWNGTASGLGWMGTNSKSKKQPALMSEQPTPWTPDEFTDALRAVGRSRYHDKHPFHQLMNDGQLEREQIRVWVAN